MDHQFKVKTEKTALANGASQTKYGIEVKSENGDTIRTVSALFDNAAEAEHFVALCNELELSLLHIDDVVADLKG